LFHAICENGALVSELPPGCAPHRMRFLDRNRLIAALGMGTLVVEAAARSGARRTATEARDLGRPLMVVPGPVTAESSVGCHRLLREEPTAVLVTCAADVLEMVGRLGLDLAPVPRGEVTPRDELTPELSRVLDAVPVLRAQGPARIAGTAGVPLSEVELALGRLALLDLVEEFRGGWRLAQAARPNRSVKAHRSGDTGQSDTPATSRGA
jgi:DNA processing protein